MTERIPWSRRELDILRDHYPLNTPLKEICLLVNRTENAVRKKASSMGLKLGEITSSIIYKGTFSKDLSFLKHPEDSQCDMCLALLKDPFYGYGRWTFDTKECAERHLQIEIKQGHPCKLPHVPGWWKSKAHE